MLSLGLQGTPGPSSGPFTPVTSRLSTPAPPCPALWSLPGVELATPGWTLLALPAPGRAQWPSPGPPARPRLTIPARPRCPSGRQSFRLFLMMASVTASNHMHVLGVSVAHVKSCRSPLIVLALVQVLELALDVAGCLVITCWPLGGRQNGEDSSYVGRSGPIPYQRRVLCV